MLYRDYLRYLAQPMPDISGIFTTSAAQDFIQPQPDGLEQIQEQIDQLEQYPVGYIPYTQTYDGGGGGGNDDTGNVDTTNNAGITGLPGLLTAASFFVNPIGTVLGYGLKKGYENYKNPYTNVFGNLNKETEEAIAREEVRDLQDRIDAGEFGSVTPTDQDARRAGQYDDSPGDGPSGPSGTSTSGSFGTRGPGMQGYGGGADMGGGPSGDPGPASGPGGGYADQATGSDTSPGATGGEGGFGPGNNDANTGDDTSPGATGGEGGGGDGCFLKGTLVTMLDGSKKQIQEIDLGDEVAKGGKVFATGKFLVNNLYDYKGIKVSGSHMVFEEGNWTRVEDSKYGKALGDEEHTVYVFGCENRRILIEDILFTDYFEVKDQDKLIEDKEKFFDNWKTFANNEDRKNVNTLNAN